ncbi:LPS export ABC transporter periplasmic protein LptC [Kordiimonas pumila]|uniref:LPS export ABC transporter periplasmic protein LptC n=1 Tax=Kordiimonas pumila TaxID=2161677 RepID=A0ABV7D9D0_9PROT|nr:LPS export ABC transporter periplasmic protein LptC [Kordiimonas pumila]
MASTKDISTASGEKNWDRFIVLMQVILPLAALVLGTITVLWPFLNDQEVSFTLSTEDVAQGDTAVHMTNLHYVGTDAINRLFHVEAATGLQENPSSPRVRLNDIRAEMALDETGPAKVQARTGIYRTKENTLSLVGGVHFNTGSGYKLDMAGAEIDLKKHIATGQGAIQGSSKLGTLEANRIVIYADTEEAVFEGGIKLHIEPKRPENN